MLLYVICEAYNLTWDDVHDVLFCDLKNPPLLMMSMKSFRAEILSVVLAHITLKSLYPPLLMMSLNCFCSLQTIRRLNPFVHNSLKIMEPNSQVLFSDVI